MGTALPQIDAAVDAGKPVPVDLHQSPNTEGHQAIIIGRSGSNLEVYNPWGYTTWVSDQQFVDGQLGDITSNSPTSGLPVATQVVAPRH